MSARFASSATRTRQAALAASLSGALLTTVTAWAEPVAYSIPAGSLASAMQKFASASSVVISFNGEELAGQQSEGLRGNYELEQGLAQLLQGTGLQLQQTGDKRYALVHPSHDGSMELAATTVSSVGLGATTEGTGSVTTSTFSGGTQTYAGYSRSCKLHLMMARWSLQLRLYPA